MHGFNIVVCVLIFNIFDRLIYCASFLTSSFNSNKLEHYIFYFFVFLFQK